MYGCVWVCVSVCVPMTNHVGQLVVLHAVFSVDPAGSIDTMYFEEDKNMYRPSILINIERFLSRIIDIQHLNINVCSVLFYSGDERASIITTLTTHIIMFLRDHNQLARKIAQNAPHLSDETIFQKVRKILGAIEQNIVYEEYLSTLLTPETITTLDLKGEDKTYDESIDPSTANVATTAALRSAHTTIMNEFVSS